MKTMHILCTFFLFLGISASLLSKSSHHFVTIKNSTNFDLIISEFEHTVKKQEHTISANSEKKCNFFKNTSYVEARVKTCNGIYYNVGSPITFDTKKITITHNQTLHIHAQ